MADMAKEIVKANGFSDGWFNVFFFHVELYSNRKQLFCNRLTIFVLSMQLLRF